MSLGEQKEQKGGRGGWGTRVVAATQTGWDRGGTEVCWAVGFPFETKENKRGGQGKSHRGRWLPAVVSVSVRPSRVLAVNIHFKESCKTLCYQQGDSFPSPSPVRSDFPVALALPCPPG